MKRIINIYTLAIFLFMVLLQGCIKNNSRISYNNGETQYYTTEEVVTTDWPTYTVTMEIDGEAFEEYAIPGQVWLLFDESVSEERALEILEWNDAYVIDSDPAYGYYLVEVQQGTESEFISQIKDYWDVDYVYPNALFEEFTASYVIDNFYGNHGDKVTQMLTEASSDYVQKYDASTFMFSREDRKEVISHNKVEGHLKRILNDVSEGGEAVINMSFGPGLRPDIERSLWDHPSVTQSDRQSYANRYVSDLVGLVKYTQRYYTSWWGGDFVIVKAAGNEGMPRLDALMRSVKLSLTSEEWDFFNEHFIIVTAKDDNKEGNYPNRVSNGGYDEMVSTVDISDMTAMDLDWQGTSFAAPRLAGYIAYASDIYEMSVSEVLTYVRKATKRSPNHVVDYEMIEEEIERGLGRGEDENEQKTNTTYSSEEGIPYYLIGTKWSYENGYRAEKRTIEFLSSNRVKITDEELDYWGFGNTSSPVVGVYDCYYDSNINRVIIKKRSDMVIQYTWMQMRIQGNSIVEDTNRNTEVEYERE